MASLPETSTELRSPTDLRRADDDRSAAAAHRRRPAARLHACATAGAAALSCELNGGGAVCHVMHLHYNASMKTATIPAVRVEPELRTEIEAVLADGETLSEFVEASVRAGVERRRVQAEFVARGLRARDVARRTGDYVDADVAVDGLQRKLDAAQARAVKKSK